MRKFFLTLFFLGFIFLLRDPAYADQKNSVQMLNKHCSACHPVERVFNIEKTSLGWTKTVNWMRKYSKNAFSQRQAIKITKNIIELHPNYAKQLFELRCAQCHELNSIEKIKLTAPQWKRLVYRERAKAIAWISLDEAEDIAAYLAKAYPLKNPTDKLEPTRELVEEKCLRCHTHSTVFKPLKSNNQWTAVNKRMQEKSPELISNKEALEISEYLSKVNPLAEWE